MKKYTVLFTNGMEIGVDADDIQECGSLAKFHVGSELVAIVSLNQVLAIYTNATVSEPLAC